MKLRSMGQERAELRKAIRDVEDSKWHPCGPVFVLDPTFDEVMRREDIESMYVRLRNSLLIADLEIAVADAKFNHQGIKLECIPLDATDVKKARADFNIHEDSAAKRFETVAAKLLDKVDT